MSARDSIVWGYKPRDPTATYLTTGAFDLPAMTSVTGYSRQFFVCSKEIVSVGYVLPLLTGTEGILSTRRLQLFGWPVPVLINALIQHEVTSLVVAFNIGLHGEFSEGNGDMAFVQLRQREKNNSRSLFQPRRQPGDDQERLEAH